MDVKKMIRGRFKEGDSKAAIPLLRGGRTFTAEIVPGGISVSNLAGLPLLPWSVFEEAVKVMQRNGGKAVRGDAMGSRLGEPGLPLNSVEGHVAHAVYGRCVGESVFRRITPIACILIWAGICQAAPGTLILTGSRHSETSTERGDV